MDDNSNESNRYSLARDRSRRVKSDKKGRFAALERLQAAKSSGKKAKYEVADLDNVYEEVEEGEYSDIVQGRQDDDWIVDDGSGYVEDGREIFDEDVNTAKDTTKNKKSNHSKKNPNIRPHNSKPSNIQAMFAAAAIKPKKPEKSASIKGDDDLGDMLAQLHQDKGTKVLPTSAKTSKQPLKAVNPFSSVPIKKVTNPKPQMKSKIVPQKQKQVIRQVALPRPTLSTALEDLGDIAADVEDDMEMQDMEMQENCEPKTNVIEPDAEMGTMDLADIDFDDDDGFGQEIDNNNSKLEAKQSVESQPMVTQASLLNESESFWADDMADTELPVDVQVDSSQLPLCTNDDGEQVIRMFWIDAYEDYYKQPGVVYLFGKVWIESAHSHVSCCVAVKNIDRRLFVLPRAFKKPANSNSLSEEPVNFMDVYKEFDEKIGSKYGINKFKSKKVTKSYAFELEGIPAESDYLEVRYAATCPALPMDVKGETFSHVFGTNTSSLEIFLLERKLKGPCWIDIKMPQLASPPVSWCKIESFVNRPDYISVCAKQMSSPPLVTMALNVRILPHPKTHQNEIIGVSCLIQREFYMDKPAPKTLFQQHFCVINKPSDCIYPFDFKDVINKMGPDKKIEVTGSERALLGYVLAKIHKIDPDLIVGHDILGFDLEVLLHRIDQNKIPHWSKIGRLKRSIMPKLNLGFNTKGGAASSAVSGRLVCDVMISGKELLRCRSYDLTEMVAQILKTQRNAVDFEEVRQCFSSSQELLRLTNYTLMDAKHALSLMYELNALPLALQITNICGNVLARTLQGGRSQRNEYLLLHAFNEKNFIVPDKTFKKKEIASIDEDMNMDVSTVKKNGKRKPAYAGGLVLEPKKGFYDSFILLLDFNSLYPSIIQEFNICFTTIVRPTNRNGQEDDDDYTSLQLPDSDIPAGILPTEIRKLVQSRRQVKQLMKRPDITQEALMQYDIRQKALKLTANSMYGCLGFSFSRFYAKPLAALVTSKGREILMKTKELTENLNYEVIYGDTDSIMINTNSTDLDEVQKIGNRIKVEVNKLHRLVEIEIDGVFKSMLLLKKKKYAALTVQKIDDQIVTSRELKGLDIVRRDWCELAKTAGNYVVDQILSGQPRETIVENIHSKLCSVSETVKNGEMDLSLYQISKQLTKNPEDYPDKKSLPHVQVALRLNTKGGKKLRSGDTIFYVICKDGSNLSATQRAYHTDELAKNETLTIDTEYYLSHQVHPVVSRLCDPIEGTDAAHIAECLGLDPSEYRRQSNQSEHNEEEALLGAQLSDEEKYRDCDRFKYACKACGNLNNVDAVFSGVSTDIHCTMKHCSNKDCNVEPLHNLSYICNQLTLTIRKHIKQYYEGQLKCEDQACNASTRKLPSHLSKGHGRCQACNRGNLQEQYTDSMLYTQLCFYRHVFDFKRAKLLLTDHKEKELVKLIPGDVQKAYETLEQHVHHVIASSAYSHVNLTRLFDGMCHLFSTPA